jgi:hypothetical protein
VAASCGIYDVGVYPVSTTAGGIGRAQPVAIASVEIIQRPQTADDLLRRRRACVYRNDRAGPGTSGQSELDPGNETGS